MNNEIRRLEIFLNIKQILPTTQTEKKRPISTQDFMMNQYLQAT